MARPAFKRRWTRVVPQPMERSTYVLFTSLALILIFVFWQPLGGTVWDVQNAALRTVLWILFAAGWGLVLLATFLIDHFDLFGLRQVWLNFTGRPYTHTGFMTPGLYRYVRHPLYLGLFLAFWATPMMTVTHLVLAVVWTAYVLAAVRLEERDMVTLHGAAYREYQQQVPMIIPTGKSYQAPPAGVTYPTQS